MQTVIIVAIVFGSIVTLAGLLCGTVLVIFKMRQSRSGAPGQANREEAKMFQEMYRGLENMEQRIEALETILMDRHDTDGDRQ